MNLIHWISPPVTSRQIRALSGVAQAIELIDQLAVTGQYKTPEYERMVAGLLSLEPETDEDVLGAPNDLNMGLELLQPFIEGREHPRKSRYLGQVIYLQRLMMRRPHVIDEISQGISQTNRQLEFYTLDSETIALSLGDLYQHTLSQLGFRIQISGEHDILSQQVVAARIRTLLFSGIRFALLWRQFGGHSRQLVLSKNAIRRQCEDLIKENKTLEKNNASN